MLREETKSKVKAQQQLLEKYACDSAAAASGKEEAAELKLLQSQLADSAQEIARLQQALADALKEIGKLKTANDEAAELGKLAVA